MNLKELVLANRSYRRFDENRAVTPETLDELVELARLTASGANRQPLKYVVSCAPAMNARIFERLAWAAYLKDWPGPAAGERPAAYIVILGDRAVSKQFFCDHGIAAQTMLLGAVERGLGGCMLGGVDKKGLLDDLGLDEIMGDAGEQRFELLLVVALGVPGEKVVLEDLGEDGDIRYWRDEHQVHHVPKRSLDELVVRRFAPEATDKRKR